MEIKALHDGGGDPIPVLVDDRDGNTLLECREAGSFLHHVTAGRCSLNLPPDSYLRGVLFLEDGAVLQLFDTFGTMSDEIVLSEDEACRLRRELR